MTPLKNPKVGDLVFWKQSDPVHEPNDYMFIYEIEPELDGETYFQCWSLTYCHNVGGVVLNDHNTNNWYLVSRLEE